MFRSQVIVSGRLFFWCYFVDWHVALCVRG